MRVNGGVRLLVVLVVVRPELTWLWSLLKVYVYMRTTYSINISSAKPLPSPRPGHRHKPIPISEFGVHVNMLHENTNQGFKDEYEVNPITLTYMLLLDQIFSHSTMDKTCQLLLAVYQQTNSRTGLLILLPVSQFMWQISTLQCCVLSCRWWQPCCSCTMWGIQGWLH